jgi:hypothetical protein
MPELLDNVHNIGQDGHGGRRMLAILDEHKLRRVLTRMLDEDEFLGPARAALAVDGCTRTTRTRRGARPALRGQLPAGRVGHGMFGGNSNWRGPVWFPISFLVLRSLVHMYAFYGDEFKIECPTGSGVEMTLFEVATEIANRMISIFLRDEDGRRPSTGGREVPDRPELEGHDPVLRVLPRRQRRRSRGEPSDRLDRLVARLIQMVGYLTPDGILEHALGGMLVYEGPEA